MKYCCILHGRVCVMFDVFPQHVFMEKQNYLLLSKIEVIKVFSCSTQLSMKFNLLVNIKVAMHNQRSFQALSHLSCSYIDVKMPTVLAF